MTTPAQKWVEAGRVPGALDLNRGRWLLSWVEDAASLVASLIAGLDCRGGVRTGLPARRDAGRDHGAMAPPYLDRAADEVRADQVGDSLKPWPKWVRYPLIAVLALVMVFGLVQTLRNEVDHAVLRIVLSGVVIPALLTPFLVWGRRGAAAGTRLEGGSRALSQLHLDGRIAARRPGYRVRRLPDITTWRGMRRQYEVACLPAGATEPAWVRATRQPATVLRAEGVQPSDIHDYISHADQTWNGDVAPWRSSDPWENR